MKQDETTRVAGHGARSTRRALRAPWLLLCGLLFGLLSLDAAAASVGMVKRMTGEVSVVRAGRTLPVTVGMRLEAADELRTGRGGSVGVMFVDNSLVSLGPNSQYTIERFAFNSTTHSGAFASRLGRGSLAMVSGKLARQSPDAVTVRTPSTMLGVRGTRFVVEVP